MAQTAGDRLKASIIDSLPPGCEFDQRELAMLAAAAKQADTIEQLELDIAERGVVVDDKLNPSVTEARLSRVALSRLLASIELLDAMTVGQLTGKRAAEKRWAA
jgi:hypothetical protein